MRYEKFVNSWFYKLMEKIYQLIILNLLTILTIVLGLGVFTFLPSLVSLVTVIKSYKNDASFPLFKGYFLAFKKCYKDAEILFLPFLGLLFLFTFNAYYFYCWLLESPTLFFNIAYYVTLIIDIIVLLGLINSAFVCSYFPYLTIGKKFKYSFKILPAISWKALIMLALLILELYLSRIILFAMPLFVVSLYYYIIYLIIRNDYQRLIPNGYQDLDIVDMIAERRNKNIEKSKKKEKNEK